MLAVQLPHGHMSLQQLLATDSDVESGLHEYVLRAMEHGKRVREWCREVTLALTKAPPTSATRDALSSPLLSTLLPFTRLPTTSSLPPFPPPLLPTSFLPALTRNQVIDALVRLSRDDRLVSPLSRGRAHYCAELISELCLEYIARRWRTEDGGEGMLGGISRKLAEIEFEVNLQGYPPTVRTAITPVLQRIRFHLGLVAPAQLISKLNALASGVYNLAAYPSFSPEQLIAAWVEIRLRAGVKPHTVLGELRGLVPRMVGAHVEVLHGVLSRMGLLQQFTSDLPHHADHPQPPAATKRTRTLSSLLTPRTPKWLAQAQAAHAHKRTSSSSSKMYLPNAPRRPSLPVISSPLATTSPPGTPVTPTSQAFLDHLTPRSSSSSTTLVGESTRHGSLPPHHTHLDADADATEQSAALLAQLVEMRYLTHRNDDAWFLSGGSSQAERLLAHVEDRAGAERDAPLLEEVASLRSTFGLGPAPPAPPVSVTKEDIVSVTVTVGGATAERLSGETLHYRDASFDLEEYLADIRVPGRERGWSRSTSGCSHGEGEEEEEEVLEEESEWDGVGEGRSESMSSGLSVVSRTSSLASEQEPRLLDLESDAQTDTETESEPESELDSVTGRVSRLSTYTIRRAVRGERREGVGRMRAVEVVLPGKESVLGGVERGRCRTVSSPGYGQLSAKEEETYTPLPPKIAQRRSRKSLATPSSTHLRITPPPADLTLPVDRHPATPPHTPTPSTPSLSSGSHDTSVSYAGSMLLTPVPVPRVGQEGHEGASGQSRRRLHRQCVIFDGEQVSPGARSFDAGRKSGVWEKHGGAVEGSGEGGREAARKGRGSVGRVLFPSPLSPRREVNIISEPSPEDSPSRPPSPPLPHPGQRSSVPLASILSLFHSHPPRVLPPSEVEQALAGFVAHERGKVLSEGGEWDAEARCRVVWVIEQVAVLLDEPGYLEAISNVVASLSSSPAPAPSPKPTGRLSPPRPLRDINHSRSIAHLHLSAPALPLSATHPSAPTTPTTPRPRRAAVSSVPSSVPVAPAAGAAGVSMGWHSPRVGGRQYGFGGALSPWSAGKLDEGDGEEEQEEGWYGKKGWETGVTSIALAE
ncbi:hypothetical protein IAT38_001086 [Cryptococcus sp. DSM 104549]